MASSLVDKITSGIRTETNVLTLRMRQEMQLLVQEVDNHRALLRQETKAFTESKKLASSRSWPLLMPNGRYCCGVCTSHASHFNHHKQHISPWLMANGGVKYADRFSNKALKHEESEMHGLALELEAERALDAMGRRRGFGELF